MKPQRKFETRSDSTKIMNGVIDETSEQPLLSLFFNTNRRLTTATSMMVMYVGDECIRDNFEMLVTVLIVFVTNSLYFLTFASGTNTQQI